MSPLQLTLETNSSAGRAATLLSKLYGQFVPDLTTQQGDKLSLSTNSGELTKLEEITTHLIKQAGKSNDAFGNSESSQSNSLKYLTRIGAEEFSGEAGIKTIDSELSDKTYLAEGNSPTAADFALLAAVYPTLSSETHSAHLAHPSLTRHFDQIQSFPGIKTCLPGEIVSIDLDNVPIVEIKPDVKVKKPAKEVPAADKSGATPNSSKGAAKDSSAAAAAESGATKKKEKSEKPKKEKAPAPAAPAAELPGPHMIDLRVGKILDVAVHPDADSLYVETIDCGEAEPRTVVSGLVKYMTLDQMRGATLITVCNLKPANMRGVKSFAMVLCASAKEGKEGPGSIEFVQPPAGSQPGDRVYFEGFQDKIPLDILNPKKKVFETVQPNFTTLETLEAAWIDPESKSVHRIMTDLGICKVENLVGANLS